MYKLLNSAMMPNARGVYHSVPLEKGTFSELVRAADATGELESYIGYPDTARLLQELCQVDIPVNNAQTEVKNGDTLLVAKLKYRVQDKSMKGRFTPTLNDFEFRMVSYTSSHIY